MQPHSTAKKAAASPIVRTHEEFHFMFATFLLQCGMNKSNLTNSTKNSLSLSLLMQKDVLETLRKEQPHAHRYLKGIDSQMEMLKNNSIPDEVKDKVKIHVQDVFQKIQHSFDSQKKVT
jgi:hypothetical protein